VPTYTLGEIFQPSQTTPKSDFTTPKIWPFQQLFHILFPLNAEYPQTNSYTILNDRYQRKDELEADF
jgi:hypothetical protein